MNIAVIGLGNILLTDEGIGVHTLNALQERYSFSPEVELIDGGTMGLDLLPFLEGRDKVLIIDAVDFGKEPGFTGMVRGEAIPSVLNSKISVHHLNLGDVLFSAKVMGIMPQEILLIGTQPASLAVGLSMTAEIAPKMETMVEMAVNILKEWGVECVSQFPQESLK
ncbi:MAG: HyaD/HybD family hydrogenase maturation endopeptidase [Nitrospirales bacterium]|nr:HyaD/HybD family hydrogenase maturation endopeptidase [Nitrospirales bacterium]